MADDDGLAGLRAQLFKHQRQRNELWARLMHLQASEVVNKQSNRDNVRNHHCGDGDILKHAFRRRGVQCKSDLVSLYRLSGITTFMVRDPGTGEHFIGVRIEVFGNRTFQAPHYLIIGQNSKSLVIHRHTIPSFIRFDKMLLNTNLPVFVRELRKDLIRCGSRRRTIASWIDRNDVKEIEATEKGDLIELTLSRGTAYIVYGNRKIQSLHIVDGQGKRLRDSERYFRANLQ